MNHLREDVQQYLWLPCHGKYCHGLSWHCHGTAMSTAVVLLCMGNHVVAMGLPRVSWHLALPW